jgi:hypothetical protein
MGERPRYAHLSVARNDGSLDRVGLRDEIDAHLVGERSSFSVQVGVLHRCHERCKSDPYGFLPVPIRVREHPASFNKRLGTEPGCENVLRCVHVAIMRRATT